MPKVSDAHTEAKKQQILAAARRVAESKPLYSVTMKEIVLESGMSQGGVYKYFPNIDAVYVAILNEAALSDRVQADVEAILADTATSPGDRLTRLLHYLGRYMQDVAHTHGKIYFELMTLYAHEPVRFLAIKDQLAEVSVLEYLQRRLRDFVLEGVADRTFVPAVPLEDLFAFLMTSIHGITQALITPPGLMPAPDVEKLVGVLAVSVRMLLGEGYRAQ